jgi:hypothetical protein
MRKKAVAKAFKDGCFTEESNPLAIDPADFNLVEECDITEVPEPIYSSTIRNYPPVRVLNPARGYPIHLVAGDNILIDKLGSTYTISAEVGSEEGSEGGDASSFPGVPLRFILFDVPSDTPTDDEEVEVPIHMPVAGGERRVTGIIERSGDDLIVHTGDIEFEGATITEAAEGHKKVSVGGSGVESIQSIFEIWADSWDWACESDSGRDYSGLAPARVKAPISGFVKKIEVAVLGSYTLGTGTVFVPFELRAFNFTQDDATNAPASASINPGDIELLEDSTGLIVAKGDDIGLQVKRIEDNYFDSMTIEVTFYVTPGPDPEEDSSSA